LQAPVVVDGQSLMPNKADWQQACTQPTNRLRYGQETTMRTSSTVPAEARAVLTINLGALRANWAALNRVSGRAECAGVIKADAYGLGLEQIAGALRDEGCRTFFVATLAEAQRVRTVQANAAIYVLDGLLPGAATAYAGFDLRPCLGSLAEVREWAAFCQATGRRLRAAVHLDTGMNRLGLPPAEVDALAAEPDLFAQFECALVMSHLACADNRAHAMNLRQKARFDAMRAKLPPAPASLANSGGVFLGPEFHYDIVRPGIALYGGRAVDNEANPMAWVVQLQARILQVREAAEGDTVGYGAAYTCVKPTKVATIACGYADGFLRAISRVGQSSGAVGFVGAHPVPVIGRVSMDLITVDVTGVPTHLAQRGGWVEVLGARTTVDDLTDRAGTIGYELLTRLGRRVHRTYLDSPSPG
jgi:alanine racemase